MLDVQQAVESSSDRVVAEDAYFALAGHRQHVKIIIDDRPREDFNARVKYHK